MTLRGNIHIAEIRKILNNGKQVAPTLNACFLIFLKNYIFFNFLYFTRH